MLGWKEVTKDETVAIDDFAGSNGNGPAEDGTVKDEAMKFAVFAAGVGARRKVSEKRIVELAAGETGREDFGINAGGNGAEMLGVKKLDEFVRVAFPDGKQSGHADAREILFAVGAEVFEENVAESDLANIWIVKDAQGMLHAGLVDGIHALRRNADFVQGQADRFGLLNEEFAADAVHADAVIAFGEGCEKRGHAELLLLEKGVKRHGTVFAAAPAEEDGFACGHLSLSVICSQFPVYGLPFTVCVRRLK